MRLASKAASPAPNARPRRWTVARISRDVDFPADPDHPHFDEIRRTHDEWLATRPGSEEAVELARRLRTLIHR